MNEGIDTQTTYLPVWICMWTPIHTHTKHCYGQCLAPYIGRIYDAISIIHKPYIQLPVCRSISISLLACFSSLKFPLAVRCRSFVAGDFCWKCCHLRVCHMVKCYLLALKSRGNRQTQEKRSKCGTIGRKGGNETNGENGDETAIRLVVVV